MYMIKILNIKQVFAILNEGCEFYGIISYRIYSGFLLSHDALDYVKLMFSSIFVLYNVLYDVVMSF